MASTATQKFLLPETALHADDCKAEAAKTQSLTQFGPPRSGSTLVFNLLRETQTSCKVRKTHGLPASAGVEPIVATYRHPFDCVVSSITRYGLPVTEESVARNAAEIERHGLLDMLSLRFHGNTLMLRYEDFHRNTALIFDSIEAFVGVPIPDDVRARLTKEYGVDEVKARTDMMGEFGNFDTVTHFHGRHVSERLGKPYSYREILTPNQTQYLAERFASFLTAFGYPAS